MSTAVDHDYSSPITQYHRQERSINDEYHINACRCDLTNTCYSSQDESPLTPQTELFLCLTAQDWERVKFVQVSNLSLAGNGYEMHPIENGRAENELTWITKKGGFCIIRLRMASGFFTTLMPSNKKITVVAEGEAVLQKVHRKDKKPKHEKKRKGRGHTANSTLRVLLRETGAGVNVTVPFRVNILVKPADALVVDYFITFAPIFLVILCLSLCGTTVCCRLRAEKRRKRLRRRRRSQQHNQSSHGDQEPEDLFKDEDMSMSSVGSQPSSEREIARIVRV